MCVLWTAHPQVLPPDCGRHGILSGANRFRAP
jgi:hypothetical protein